MLQTVKNLSEMQKNRVQSLGWEDPLEKEMTTHSSILAWRIPWTEEPGGLQSMRSWRIRHDLATNTFIFIFQLLYVEKCEGPKREEWSHKDRWEWAPRLSLTSLTSVKPCNRHHRCFTFLSQGLNWLHGQWEPELSWKCFIRALSSTHWRWGVDGRQS